MSDEMRDGAAAEIYDVTMLLAKTGIAALSQSCEGDSRAALAALYTASSALSRGLRNVLLTGGDEEALPDLDSLAAEVATRFAEEMPAGPTGVADA